MIGSVYPAGSYPGGKVRAAVSPNIVVAPPNAYAPRMLGVTLTWTASWQSDLDTYAAMVGRMPNLYSWFSNFANSFPSSATLNAINAKGCVPFVTLEPWDGVGTGDPTYKLSNITAGNFDTWFSAGATQAAAYGKPFYVRFAPEMNGNWSPWGAGVNGNTAQDFINAWVHVYNLFAGTPVKWVWCPNVISGPAVDFTPYYPWQYVDVLALDGYNWGSTLGIWQTWSQVFGTSYDTLAALDSYRPVFIGEVGSAEAGGDKAAWITSAYNTEIPSRTPRVQAVVWFNENKETDWRVESSPNSLAAYQAIATQDSGKTGFTGTAPAISTGLTATAARANFSAVAPALATSVTAAVGVMTFTSTAPAAGASLTAVPAIATFTASAPNFGIGHNIIVTVSPPVVNFSAPVPTVVARAGMPHPTSLPGHIVSGNGGVIESEVEVGHISPGTVGRISQSVEVS